MAIRFLLLGLLVFSTESCKAVTQISDFYSGRATFELPINESTSLAFSYQTYNITLPRKYDRSSVPQYAFALAAAGALTGNLTYFDLLVLKTFEASLVVNFIYEPGRWARTTYNYWVAFRSDINLGIDTLSASQIANSKGTYEVAYSMRRSAVPDKAAALVFLSGMRFDSNGTEGHQLSFIIEKQYISNGQLVFSFTCNTTLALSSLTFAFVVFDPHSLPFASYGGTISSKDLAATTSQDLQYIVVASSADSLFGVSSIEAGEAFSLSSSLLDNLTLTYGVNSWERLSLLEVTYVVIGPSPASICLRNSDCQAVGQILIFGQSCVSSCPAASKPIIHMDGAVECVPCPLNTIYTNATQKCVCPSGYSVQSNGSCLPQTQSEGSGVAYNRASAGDSLSGGSDGVSECLKIVGVNSNNKNLFITIQAGNQVLLDPESINNDYIQLQFGSA
jgi:hypothetical protein